MVDDSDDPLRVFLNQYEYPISVGDFIPIEDYVNYGPDVGNTSIGTPGAELGEGVSSGIPKWDEALDKAEISTSIRAALNKLPDWVKNAAGSIGSEAVNFLKNNYGKVGLAGLMAYLASQQARPAMGGGTTQAYQGPAPLKREVVQGKYGPVAQYAANGGLMHAYAHGGHVNMEDGGFVMTKRAVDGAGGPKGLAALVPGVRPIRGPGTGTSDSIPATIHGTKGQTPARVSNGEAYVPREAVQRMGGAQQMYNLMNNLQRRA